MLDVFSFVCQTEVPGHRVHRIHCRAEVWSVLVPSSLQQHKLDNPGGAAGRGQGGHV